ncbi:hypothetical protein SAMN04488515_2971 [Cognatiyoonia koreensis]|uniref:Translocase n=1 Tax=Cognatiyoonia koreensis TaxID=364200 RepID=A0A1I0RNA8_9RHOB|nr:hypothetical protein [Cognatiyoonia koreensis]SEW42514.1 hypothetical protein SAMN04488515_2971 [Cognatiyoonia koreensis]
MQRTRARRYATIVATFGVALGIGFVMQNGDAVASRLGVDAPKPEMALQEFDTYIPVRATGLPHSITDEGSVFPDMMAPLSEDGADAGCEITFEAAPSVAAMVNLVLEAPCHSESLVLIQHQGLKFQTYTDATGHLDVAVPALSKEAFFLATLEQGTGVVAITGVPDLSKYDRAVLQWSGTTEFQLHALEFGSDVGGEGHVWAAASRSPEVTIDGVGGFLTQLGTLQDAAPMRVQVYTFPSGMSLHDGDVALSVKAEITADNCGRNVAAQSIQLSPDHPPAARNISMRVPGCDNVGEFLQLKNLFEDLTLAAR